MMTWAELIQAVERCTSCPLQGGSPVVGTGSLTADIMIVGEAPGREEAARGVPFVGASGKRLDQLLPLARLRRDDLYLTNTVLHRPPENRTPYVGEQKACRAFLDAQLELIEPSVIITLGGTAARVFSKVQLTKDHGLARLIEYNGRAYTLVPMYHPAAALRSGDVWKILVADFLRLPEELSAARTSPDEPEYTLVNGRTAGLYALSSGRIGFDLETTSPRRGKYFAVQEAEIVGFSVSARSNEATYTEGVPAGSMTIALQNDGIVKVCHQAKFEYGVLANHKIHLVNFQDTKLAAWMLQHHSIHLKALARQLLGRDPMTIQQLMAHYGVEDMGELSASEHPLLVDYGAADADNTLLIWPILERELKAAGMWDLYEQVELPLIPVLHDMESRGVNVDSRKAKEVLDDLNLEQDFAEIQANLLLPGRYGTYRVGATDQLAAAFQLMGAPIRERTDAKKQMKTSEEVLKGIRNWNAPLVDAVLHYKSTQKMRSYAKQYDILRGPDGRLHPDWVQTGAGEETSDVSSFAPVTGRLSCRGPNLQNQPHHKEGNEQWAQRLRECIIPSEGMVFVSGDVEQEEPRIASFVTGDSQLQADFASGIPIYAPIAEIIFGRAISKTADPTEWHIAKTNFLALGYGASWQKVMELTGLSASRAKGVAAALADRYPGLVRHYQKTAELVAAQGYVTDYFNRRRLFPKVYNQNQRDREAAFREAANDLIQGPGGTIIKMAMGFCHREFKGRAFLLLTEHDGLMAECLPEEVDRTAKILRECTKGLMPIELPVEISVGRNWGEMQAWR